VTADHQKVVHPQEDLPADQKAAVLAARVMTQELHVSSEDRATIQVPHVHHVPNHPIVFQENANHSIAITAKVEESAVHSEIVSHLMENASPTKVENANHSIAITAKVEESAVHSEIVSHLMARENPTKVENANHSIAITAKEASANRTKAANASLLVELKTQHVHRTKEIIAGIAMRPLR
jgi:hypothetical protein